MLVLLAVEVICCVVIDGASLVGVDMVWVVVALEVRLFVMDDDDDGFTLD